MVLIVTGILWWACLFITVYFVLLSVNLFAAIVVGLTRD